MDGDSLSIRSEDGARIEELSPLKTSSAKKNLLDLTVSHDDEFSEGCFFTPLKTKKKKKKTKKIAEEEIIESDSKTTTERCFDEMRQFSGQSSSSGINNLIMLYRAYASACGRLEQEMYEYHPIIFKEYDKGKSMEKEYTKFKWLATIFMEYRQCYHVPCIMDSRSITYDDVRTYCDIALGDFSKLRRLLIKEFEDINLIDHETRTFMEVYPITDIARVRLLPFEFLSRRVLEEDWNKTML